VTLRSTTLGDVLREHRRSWPRQVAIVCGDARLRYPELDDRVSKLASVLRARGIEAAGRVLWLGQGCHRFIETWLAVAKLGGVVCPVNWRQSASELAFVLHDFAPRVVLWQDEELGEVVREARALAGGDAEGASWIQHDGRGDDGYEALLERAAAADLDLEVDASSPVLCMYTAAFEGKPRGALLSHDALLVQALVNARYRDIDSTYVYLNSGPLFHMATFMFTAATFLAAGTNVMTRRADPERICRLIHDERCTGAFLMPPTIAEIARLNARGDYDLESLRAYAASPEWNAMVTLDTTPAGRAPGGYGQTEVTGLLTLGALGGRPIPLAQVRIVDGEGREVAPGEIGEIVVRGPTVMNGYLGGAAPGAWHHTNDLGRREEDGAITFVGPMARLIKSGAENVYPAEVEACLRAHPAVAACAVIGVPDARWGQSVLAIVVLRPGLAAAVDELVEHCRARIASYKKPRYVEYVEALPRRGHGVDYEALERRFGTTRGGAT